MKTKVVTFDADDRAKFLKSFRKTRQEKIKI